MKMSFDGKPVPDRIWYYLLDYIVCEEMAVKISSLHYSQIIQLFQAAVMVDAKRMKGE